MISRHTDGLSVAIRLWTEPVGPDQDALVDGPVEVVVVACAIQTDESVTVYSKICSVAGFVKNCRPHALPCAVFVNGTGMSLGVLKFVSTR